MKHTFIAIMSALVIFFVGCENRAVSDAALTTTVKTRLATDPDTSAIRINVDTSNAVVTLSGAVPTAAEKAEAERVARNTEGVRQVVNNITIDKDKSAVGGGEMLSDAAILTSIKTQLLASGIVGTNVDVKNGEVTITGAVENAQEKAKAEEIARQAAGVKSVKSQLTIRRE